jgi:hypothetical protein
MVMREVHFGCLAIAIVVGCSGSRKQTKDDAAGAHAGSGLASAALVVDSQAKVDDKAALVIADDTEAGADGERPAAPRVTATSAVGKKGDPLVVVTVKWPTPPNDMFTTPVCEISSNVKRRSVTTTKLVMGAVVEVQDVALENVAESKSRPIAPRLLISRCGISPTASVTTGEVLITSLAATTVSLRSTAPSLAEHSKVSKPKVDQPLQFPVAGHSVLLNGLGVGVYKVQLTADSRKKAVPELAGWVVVTKQLATTTDADGIALIAVPEGKHRLMAWLPSVVGSQGAWASADIEVKAGQENRLTIELNESSSVNKKGRP